MKMLRNNESHWLHEKDESKALKQYLQLGERVYNKTKFTLMRRLTDDVKGKKMLDYGGGAGIMAIPYAQDGAEVILVDAESNALNTAIFYAKKQKVESKIRTIHADVFPENLKKKRFDIVIAKDIIEHIHDDRGFLKDLSDCQDKGGILLLSTQNSFSLNYLLEGSYQKYIRGNKNWCGWDTTHLRFYTRYSLKEKLNLAGYSPQKWASVYIIPYNIFSWFFLLKVNIYASFLHKFDLLFGTIFPFNRLGWNIIVRAKKVV
jgi:2-polyprenyl-6-hydroxyphenyl methylase/3-demethylubiquinone-9 3-methyltransferase